MLSRTATAQSTDFEYVLVDVRGLYTWRDCRSLDVE